MYACPNCDAPLVEDALTCSTCAADFGPLSSWRPIPVSKRKRGSKAAEAQEKPGGLWTKLAGTMWLVCWTALLVLVLPRLGKTGGMIFLLYATGSIWALYRLWQRGTYSTLYLILGLAPLFLFPFLLVLAVLYSAMPR